MEIKNSTGPRIITENKIGADSKFHNTLATSGVIGTVTPTGGARGARGPALFSCPDSDRPTVAKYTGGYLKFSCLDSKFTAINIKF
ncbi:hypothetical protein EVAR_84325_1 [Eumeta japonica]|uniref:Uncharacterized protein n=1 Tax=Eumeta variegata TaxID=151549 RepID=A0A4C1U4E2_EUMVA|nr:hypothetical protein EVAR_84325_1 [Eumeta japonica]